MNKVCTVVSNLHNAENPTKVTQHTFEAEIKGHRPGCVVSIRDTDSISVNGAWINFRLDRQVSITE